MRRFTFLFLVLLFISEIISAQSEINFSAQLRARSSYDNRDFSSDIDGYGYTELRTRAAMEFRAPLDITGVFQIQDSRIYGTEPSTLSNTDNLDIHQAFVKVSNLFKLPVDIKFGRMEVNLGNERLVGAVGWSNIGRSLDGSILSLHTGAADLHLMGFQINEQFQQKDSLDNIFAGLWVNLKLTEKYITDVFILHEKILRTDYLSRTTLGFYVKGNLNRLEHEIEFAYQSGSIKINAMEQDVNAVMFAANISYIFEAAIKPKVSAGIDYLSGDDDPEDKDYKSFNTLYATNHKFYGYMDYFTLFPAHTLNLGLIDIHAKVSIYIIADLNLGLNFHVFNANEEFISNDGSTSKSFGTEFDFTAVYTYSKNMNFQAGLSLFTPGDIFKEVHGKDSSLWGYLMATVNL